MDYADLGFKCGLEVHQRLDTRKLFCDCYCNPNAESDAPPTPATLARKFRAVIGELGKVDAAAEFETLQSRSAAYELDETTSCAVEMDEEPPHPINADALMTCLTVSKLLQARILDMLFVMRKTVVDGSAVSGFQRTALVALDGKIQTSKGEVQLPTIALEEESAGILDKAAGGSQKYRLDRLGIPLLEIATAPTLKDGAHAREAAEVIGQLLRSTGKVQRGLGSIRQDLNVSIAQGARVEIKGAQDLSAIPALIDNEVKRQISLLKAREELKARHILLGEEHFNPRDVAGIFSATGCKLISAALRRGEGVLCLKLAGFAGIFGMELMGGHTLGREASHYAMQYAGVGGIMHSDEPLEERYGISSSELSRLKKDLNFREGDLLALCASPIQKGMRALKALFNRCVQLQKGIPEETRRAEGTISAFLRPLPGSARMYPETDLLPIPVTPEMLLAATESLPESPEEKRSKYAKWGLNPQLAESMLHSQDWQRFEFLVEKAKVPALTVAVTLLETLVTLKREGLKAGELTDSDLMQGFFLLSQSKISKNAIPELLRLKCLNPAKGMGELVAEYGLERLTDSQLRALISGLAGSPEKKFADIMKKYRLRADAAQLRILLESK